MMGKKGETSLAKELQGKPVVVDIYATWCPGCKNIALTISNWIELITQVFFFKPPDS